MREQALFEPADEDAVKFQPLGGVHRHQLHRILPGLRLVVAGLQCSVRQKGRQRRDGLASGGRLRLGGRRPLQARRIVIPGRRVGVEPLADR